MIKKKISLILLGGLLFSGCAGQETMSMRSEGVDGAGAVDTFDGQAVLDGTDEDNMMVDPEQTGDKIIYNGSMDLETEDLSTFSDSLKEALEEAGGFLESESSAKDPGSQTQSASFQIRVPASQYDAFVEKISGLATVRNENKTASNITKSYNDAQQRIDSLEQERSRLLELMDKAESVADLVAVEDQLRQVQDEIRIWQESLNQMDSDIQYSTIWIYVQETSVTGGIGQAFSDTWNAFGKGLGLLAIVFAYALPWLLTIGIMALVIWFIVRRYRKHPSLPKRPDQVASQKEPEK